MIHRHLDYPEQTPVSALGDAALDNILERGDLDDWRPLARAIAADPAGELAERVLRLCEANPKFGTSPLWRAWIARRRLMDEPLRLRPVSLAEVRRRQRVSQDELSAVIGMSQSDLSKAERRTDWKVSTLAAIVRGLGMRLRLVVEDADGRAVGEIEVDPRHRVHPDADETP